MADDERDNPASPLATPWRSERDNEREFKFDYERDYEYTPEHPHFLTPET